MNLAPRASTQSGNTGVNLIANAGNVTFGDFDVSPDSSFKAMVGTTTPALITTTSGDVSSTGNTVLEIIGARRRRPNAALDDHSQHPYPGQRDGIGLDLNFVSGNLNVTGATTSRTRQCGNPDSKYRRGNINFQGNNVSNISCERGSS